MKRNNILSIIALVLVAFDLGLYIGGEIVEKQAYTRGYNYGVSATLDSLSATVDSVRAAYIENIRLRNQLDTLGRKVTQTR